MIDKTWPGCSRTPGSSSLGACDPRQHGPSTALSTQTGGKSLPGRTLGPQGQEEAEQEAGQKSPSLSLNLGEGTGAAADRHLVSTGSPRMKPRGPGDSGRRLEGGPWEIGRASCRERV